MTSKAQVELGIPGIAVAVWHDGKLVEAAAGVRALGTPEIVQPKDAFHIGSISKSFTSTLAAKLIEEGKLNWETTIGEVLGKRVSKMNPAFQDVTIEDLLAHQGGIIRQLDPARLAELAEQPTLGMKRLAAASIALSSAPAAPPRTASIYSNPGYVVAAAMIESITGQSWEDLVREKVMQPLKLVSAGFGPPLEGARGHRLEEDGSFTPLDPKGPLADNPQFVAPAGGLHMSVGDLARFGSDHVRGMQGKAGTLLRPESYRRLHTEHFDHTALGWGGGPGGTFDNSGSNRRWLAYIRGVPNRNLVVAIAVNAIKDQAQDEDRISALAGQIEAMAE